MRKLLLSTGLVLFIGMVFFMSVSENAGSRMVSNLTDCIVFVPGFYGSELIRKDNNEKIWITASKALFGSDSLTMPFPELKVGGEAFSLFPGNLLGSVRVIPGLYSYALYQPTIDYLKKAFPARNIEVFAFDWRDDLVKSIHELHKFLANLKAQGNSDITLVSHSLGSYLTAYYLRYGDQELENAIENWGGTQFVNRFALLTAPFQGSGFILRNLHYGRPVGLNNKILTAKAFATFPVSYYFVPQLQKEFLVDRERKAISSEVSEVETWVKYGWGLFSPNTGIENQDDQAAAKARFDFTSHYLARGKKYMELIQAPLKNKPNHKIDLFSLLAEKENTINKIKVLEFGKIEDPYNGDPLAMSIGDGTLTSATQTLPDAYQSLNVKFLKVKEGHLEALSNKNFRNQLFDWIMNP